MQMIFIWSSVNAILCLSFPTNPDMCIKFCHKYSAIEESILPLIYQQSEMLRKQRIKIEFDTNRRTKKRNMNVNFPWKWPETLEKTCQTIDDLVK